MSQTLTVDLSSLLRHNVVALTGSSTLLFMRQNKLDRLTARTSAQSPVSNVPINQPDKNLFVCQDGFITTQSLTVGEAKPSIVGEPVWDTGTTGTTGIGLPRSARPASGADSAYHFWWNHETSQA